MPISSAADSKQLLRRRLRQRRRVLPIRTQTLAALALARRLQTLRLSRPGGLLLGTLSHRGEIDAHPFLQLWLEAGGRLALPRVDLAIDQLEIRTVNHLDQTVLGFRGIMEPDPDSTVQIPARSVTVLLVPGLAFDHRGNRLGQGGGHYDRLLALVDDSAVRVGIAHDFQILPAIPNTEVHDQPMDFVVSPIRVIDCGSRRARLAPG